MSEEHVLLVPLGSNAHSLVAGEAVDDLRRRLKQASITFDGIVLEQGTLRVNAGPNGSSAFRGGGPDAEFQTPEQRETEEASGFVVAFGPESVPGVTSTDMRTFIESPTSISWAATLEPFEKELPTGVDWLRYASLPSSPAIRSTADNWSRVDKRNAALQETVPEPFVRNLVIKNANTDLAVGAHEHVAVMQDPMHRQVVAARLNDDVGWRGIGFSLPVILPEVGHLDWDTVADIRKHKAMTAFREALRDVEDYALAQVADGDVETAVHRAFERYQAKAMPRLAGLPDVGKNVLVEMGIGTMLGLATAGFSGPLAIPTAAALGVMPLAVRGTVGAFKDRGRRWDYVFNALLDATDPGM